MKSAKKNKGEQENMILKKVKTSMILIDSIRIRDEEMTHKKTQEKVEGSNGRGFFQSDPWPWKAEFASWSSNRTETSRKR